ncbi:type IX secretion system plug protein [Flavitalea flava]
MNRCFLFIIILAFSLLEGHSAKAQTPDSVYSLAIATPQLFIAGNQLGYPILRLNTNDQLELHFDDLDGDVKNYSYTYQLCNADWTPAIVSQFDFIRGFSQVRFANYQFSSVALTRYTHYQALLPDQNCLPIRSGNYLVKVFLDGDTSKLAFVRRMLITDGRISVHPRLFPPLDYQLAHTHQRIQMEVNVGALNPANPLDQIKVVVLQNYRWDNAIRNMRPTFFSNNKLEYSSDNDCVFPAGREYRWLDLQSFRYQSDRIQNATYGKTSTDIMVRPDADRSRLPFYFYKDYNGFYFIQTTESLNPLLQTDYATVHFSFVPPGNISFPGKDVYILGQFTGGGFNDSTRLIYNAEKGRYEIAFFLKQGYYNYSYVTIDHNDPEKRAAFDLTEGNFLETENDYTVLVYYRALGSRADELVGISAFNSLNK